MRVGLDEFRTIKKERKSYVITREGKGNANLTAKWTESKRVQKAPATDFTQMRNSFWSCRFGLRPFIQEHHSCTVYYICLYSTYIYCSLYFWNSNHIMIWWPSYLPPPHKFLLIRDWIYKHLRYCNKIEVYVSIIEWEENFITNINLHHPHCEYKSHFHTMYYKSRKSRSVLLRKFY